MNITRLGLVALACASLACAPKPTPVTVTGDAGDRASLAGKWSGEYTSPATVVTTFTGTLSGNTIDGTFSTRGSSNTPQTGTWRVKRANR